MAADDPALPDEASFVLRERYAVALFEEADEGHNTIVLSGIDVVVPLEIDIDGDPFQDDVVSLRSVHGLYEQVLSAGDPDVRRDPERRIAFYRFRLVPPGLYRLAARIGDAWATLGTRLVVTREGARWNGHALSAAPPSVQAAEADGVIDEVYASTDDDDGRCCGGEPDEEEHEHG